MFEKVNKLGFGIVRVAGTAIMLFLAICALADTWYMLPGGEEIPLHRWDSVPANLFAAAMCFGVLFGLFQLEKRLSGRLCRRISEGIAVLVTVWAFSVGIWWIFSAERLPGGDQAFIYGGASYFRLGDFSFLDKGGYCHIYPYQLGLISLTELLYHVIRPFQYRPLQVVNALAAAGIVYMGYRLVKEWSDSFCAEIMYSLMISLCFPLFFYTTWVYGDVVSVFFVFLGVFFLCRYERYGKTGYLAGMALAMTLAQLLRLNTAIVYIALALVTLVHLPGSMKVNSTGHWLISRFRWLWHESGFDKKLLVMTVVSILLPYLLFMGIYRIYEVRSGIEHSEGCPAVLAVALGMQESRYGCGWDNNYQKDTYYTAEYDFDKMRETGAGEIRERLRYFLDNPVYMTEFYGKKILSQWSGPLYQSVFFSADYSQSAPPREGTLAESISGPAFWIVLEICDRVQFIVYLGMLLWFLLAVKEDKGILRQILAVAVIGGFLFSLLWEAKTRYILPYYLFMFPCAAVGYREFYCHCAAFRRTVTLRHT